MNNTRGGRPHGRRARPQRRRRRLAVGSAGAARTGPPTKPTRHATGTTDAPTGEHSAVRGMNIHDAPAKCDTTLPMRCRGGRQERAPQPRSRHPHKVSLRAKVRPPYTGSYGFFRVGGMPLRGFLPPKRRLGDPALKPLYLSRHLDVGGWAVAGGDPRCEVSVVHFFECSNSKKPLDLETPPSDPRRPALAARVPNRNILGPNASQPYLSQQTPWKTRSS